MDGDCKRSKRRAGVAAISVTLALLLGLGLAAVASFRAGLFCFGSGWVSDFDPAAQGAETREQAIAETSGSRSGSLFPPPADGWRFADEALDGDGDTVSEARLGLWRVTLHQTDKGGWVATGASCGSRP